jgi:hypothetical protein
MILIAEYNKPKYKIEYGILFNIFSCEKYLNGKKKLIKISIITINKLGYFSSGNSFEYALSGDRLSGFM